MIIDFNNSSLENVATKADACVIGTGPAGMTTARKLAEYGHQVLLLEAGTFDYSDQSQELYQGESVGPAEYFGIDYCRLRQLGGTSGHWSGRCAPFEPYDFERAPRTGLPGWPISYDDAYAHMHEAKKILDLPAEGFGLNENKGWQSDNLKPNRFAMSPPTRFGEKYRTELEKSERITLVINANLTDLTLTPSGSHIATATVRNYKQETTTVSAPYFVLALGALETSRLLLNCRNQMPNGLGNRHDMVGRCFMEHFGLNFGRFVTTDAEFWAKGAVPMYPSEKFQRKHNIGAAIMAINPSAKPRSFGRTAAIKSAFRNMVCKSETLTDWSRRMGDFDCPGDGVVTSLCEQEPNLNSRIMLNTNTSTDPFGHAPLSLNWEMSDHDLVTVKTLALQLGKDLAERNLARLQIKGWILHGHKPDSPGFHCHQMGGARMSDDPRYGVVDKNQLMHGIANLYIAGASVFATGSGVNPTFTIVAMSLRLGAHLGERIKRLKRRSVPTITSEQ